MNISLRGSLFFLACAFALGGCGVSKEAFIAKADPDCKAGNQILAVLATPTDMASLKDFATKVSDATSKTQKQLSALEAPGGDQGTKVASLISGLAAGGKKAADLADAVGREDLPGAESSAADTAAALKKADDSFRTFGMHECGKGGAAAGGTIATATGPILKKAYIAKADAVCAKFNDVGKAMREPNSLADFKAIVRKVTEMGQKYMADLRAIPPTVADKPALDEWFAQQDKGLAKLAEVKSALDRGDIEGVGRLASEVDALGNSADALANRFGFKDCGSS